MFEPDDTTLIYARLARATVRLASQFDRVLDTIGAPHGLTAGRFRVLAVLREFGPLTVASLARRQTTSRQASQRIVDELREDGFVVLADNPDHKRARLVVPTEAGRAALETVFAAFAAWAATTFSDIDHDRLCMATGLLTEVMQRLDGDDGGKS